MNKLNVVYSDPWFGPSVQSRDMLVRGLSDSLLSSSNGILGLGDVFRWTLTFILRLMNGQFGGALTTTLRILLIAAQAWPKYS